MKRIITFVAALSAVCTLGAQDLHYSMFTMAPLTLNPALTGNFTGDLRIVNNYRMQWSPIAKPYTTYTFGGDMPLPRKDKRKASPDFFALGLNVNVDKAGSSSLKNNAFNLTASYNKSLDGVGATYFSFGFMAGAAQRSITLGNASWDMQFDGLNYDPSLPSGENHQADSYLYFDYSAGAAITSVANDRFKMCGGLALSHLNRPNIAFLGGSDKLYMKITAHYTAQIALGQNSNAWLVPALQIEKQGPARKINAGAGVKYRLSERSHYTNYQSEKSMTIGGMYRLGDAASGYIRFDLGPIGAAFNYDLNLSKLTAATNGMGAMEFMLIYTGIYHSRNTRMANPSFF